MDIQEFLTIAGAGAVIVPVIEAIKRAARWDAEATDRLAPLLSLVIGVLILVVGTLVSVATDVNRAQAVFSAILQGILAGASSAAIYNIGGKEVVRAVAGTPEAEKVG